jgi:putative dehydrogenase
MTNDAKLPLSAPQSVGNPIGFIGIGNMGFAMMHRLLAQSWACASFDLDPVQQHRAHKLGASTLSSAKDIGLRCRVTFVVVVDAKQVNEVLAGENGLLRAAQPGDVIFLCPTLGPIEVTAAAHQAHQLGITVIDAPMSGGPVRARDGQMSLMLSGDSQILKQYAALLDAITHHRFVVSENPGDAAKTKLANNLLAAINLAGVSEVLAMAQSWGLNPETTLSVMQASSGQSWIGQDRMQRALQNDFAPRAHTSLLAKDTRLALQACDALGIDQPSLGQLASLQFEKACTEGYKDLDDASLFLMAGGKPLKPSR